MINIYIFVLISFFLFCGKLYSNDKIEVLKHLDSLKYFSASFIQNDGDKLSEGRFYIGENRIRVEYIVPEKILIILAKNKAMYYNYELEEDEFFNPKNTSAWFFYDIFRDPLFFEDSKVTNKNNELILEKKGVDTDKNNYLIRAYFELKPTVLRRFEVYVNSEYLEISIYNHNHNEEFNNDFFKLISPVLLN